MVNLENEQLPRRRGRSKNPNEKFSWIPTSLESRIIVCFCARPVGEPNWESVSNNCKRNRVEAWELKHEIDQQKVLYTAVDAEKKHQVSTMATRSNINFRGGVAYPSESLHCQIEGALRQAHRYELPEAYVGAISEDTPGVYLFFEGKDAHPLYVGKTMSLSKRFVSRFWNPKDPIGHYLQWVYRNADRQETINRGQWSLRFIPFEQALGFAVQGQLAPDLDSNPSARSLLEIRYKEKLFEGLDAAESALIAHFCPHLNVEKNTYPHPLHPLRQKYCQEDCSAHRGSSRSKRRKREKV